jgi:hypothetical protein
MLYFAELPKIAAPLNLWSHGNLTTNVSNHNIFSHSRFIKTMVTATFLDTLKNNLICEKK